LSGTARAVVLERGQSIEAINFNSVRALGGASLEQPLNTTTALVVLLTNLEMLHDIYATLLSKFGSTKIWNRHRARWLRFGNFRGVGNRRLSPDITISNQQQQQAFTSSHNRRGRLHELQRLPPTFRDNT